MQAAYLRVTVIHPHRDFLQRKAVDVFKLQQRAQALVLNGGYRGEYLPLDINAAVDVLVDFPLKVDQLRGYFADTVVGLRAVRSARTAAAYRLCFAAELRCLPELRVYAVVLPAVAG